MPKVYLESVCNWISQEYLWLQSLKWYEYVGLILIATMFVSLFIIWIEAMKYIIEYVRNLVVKFKDVVNKFRIKDTSRDIVWAEVINKSYERGSMIPIKIGNVTTFTRSSENTWIALRYNNCVYWMEISNNLYNNLDVGDRIECEYYIYYDRNKNVINTSLSIYEEGYFEKCEE